MSMLIFLDNQSATDSPVLQPRPFHYISVLLTFIIRDLSTLNLVIDVAPDEASFPSM